MLGNLFQSDRATCHVPPPVFRLIRASLTFETWPPRLVLPQLFRGLPILGTHRCGWVRRRSTPLRREHIGLTGDYVWTEANPAAPSRPLRDVGSMFSPWLRAVLNKSSGVTPDTHIAFGSTIGLPLQVLWCAEGTIRQVLAAECVRSMTKDRALELAEQSSHSA
jgi:hypothetical protein